MAVLYWLHRQDELNMFESGYIGVTKDLAARMRCHKHRFKKIWEQLKITVLVIGSCEYLFPNFQGWYITPLGRFESPEEASKVHGVHPTTISRRCRGRIVNGIKLQPHDGYAFDREGRVKP